MTIETNLRQAIATILIERVATGLKAALEGAWTPDVFAKLNRRDFEQTLSETPSALDFGIALDELSLRAEVLTPAEREALLVLIVPLPEALKPARDFFKRIEPELQRIRELQVYYKATLGQQIRRQDAGLQRVSVIVRKEDVEKVRAFADDLNRRSGVDKIPRPKRGRPPKANVAELAPTTKQSPHEALDYLFSKKR
ncbi:MAG: hypothetical protein ING69_10760 [Rhodocyclaceae bacterium]|nr:hypothetical protein [Rhodocyclaceae bacterium]